MVNKKVVKTMTLEEMNKYKTDLGRRVKEYRERRSMTQTELAKKIGYDSRATISRIEKGTIMATQITIEKLAIALDIPPRLLLEDATENVDYMLDGMLIEKAPLPRYTIEEELLIELYRMLNADEKRKIIEIIKKCNSDGSAKSELA